MKLCWIVVLVGISIILVFLYSLVAMSSRSERFIEQLMEEGGRKDTDVQDMEAIITLFICHTLYPILTYRGTSFPCVVVKS